MRVVSGSDREIDGDESAESGQDEIQQAQPKEGGGQDHQCRFTEKLL